MLEENYSEIPVESNNRKKWVLLAVGVIILILIGGGIFWWMNRSKESMETQVLETPVTNISVEEVPAPVVDPYPNDKDRDGIDDTKEKELGTSNRDFDTDGDGLSDFDEIEVWKTNPTKMDSDGDGFNDGYEVLSGYNPLGDGPLE